MAAFMNVAGTPLTPQFVEILCRGEVTQSAGVRSIVQVYHLKQRFPFIVVGMGDLVDAVKGTLEGSLSAALSITYTALDWRGRFMDDPTATDLSRSNGIVGAITGDRLPTFNSAVVQMRGDARGRNFKGSKHFAPVAESDTTLDKLNAGAITRWQAVATAIEGLFGVGSGAGDQWDPIVLSTTLSDLVANPSLFSGAVLSDTVLNNLVGTMKRRKEKAGT